MVFHLNFYDLKQLLDAPERLSFCLDFAHAHAFGYDLSDAEHFIDLLDTKMGIDQIALLHLHDSAEPQGSSHDRHALIGEGTIGTEQLKKLVLHPRLINKPIILELPRASAETSRAMLQLVEEWHN